MSDKQQNKLLITETSAIIPEIDHDIIKRFIIVIETPLKDRCIHNRPYKKPNIYHYIHNNASTYSKL